MASAADGTRMRRSPARAPMARDPRSEGHGSRTGPQGGLGPFGPAQVRRLQRIVGNRAVTQLMSPAAGVAATPAPRPRAQGSSGPPEPHVLPLQRDLTRGSGWGWPWWVDSGAAQLWKDLDRKFNRELPALDKKLAELLRRNPSAKDLADIRAELARTAANHDGAIHHDDAADLNTILDTIIDRAEKAAASVVTLRAQAQELIQSRLTALAAMQVRDSSLTVRRKNLVKMTNEFLRDESNVFNRSALFKELRTLESDFRVERNRQAEREHQAEKAKAEEELQGRLDAKERERRNSVLSVIAQTMPSYGAALTLCGGDVDLLHSLVAFVRPGELKKLEPCLRKADAGQVLGLLNTCPSVTDVNRLLEKWRGGDAVVLKTLLGRAGQAQVETLLTVLDRTKEEERHHLEGLLETLGVNLLDRLLKQSTVTVEVLAHLFVQQRVDVAETKTLLASSSGAHTVYLLEKVPDPHLINQVLPLATSPEELRSLISDLSRDAAAVRAVKVLFTRPVPPTLADIKALQDVREVRGLVTAAGVVIRELDVAQLPVAERRAVEAGLTGIDTGKAPNLTHPNRAKFGDTWENDAGRLPGVRGAAGYKEYYVEKDPASVDYHGQRRLVVRNVTKHVYYTSDHYQTFARVR